MFTENLAQFVCGLHYEDVPSHVVSKAKLCLLDYLGVTLGGLGTPESRVAHRLTNLFGRASESSVVGMDTRVPSNVGALANGIIGHALELDDGSRRAYGHPGVTVIPAVLALGGDEHSGKDVLTSIVAGYEVFGKIGRAVNPSHLNRGFHPTGTCGTFAAAAACSNLLGFSAEETLMTLGVAGSYASGLFEFVSGGEMTKPLQAGRAAQAGVLSALGVREGLTGPRTILEGKRGFFRAYSDQEPLESLMEDMGKDFEILSTYLKVHASCRHTHSAVDACIELRRRLPRVEDIQEILVRTYSIAAALDERNIQTALSAKMSLPFSVAVALIRGQVTLKDFQEPAISDPAVKSLMQRIRVKGEEAYDRELPEKRTAEVTVLVDGAQQTARVDVPKGEPENPVSADQQLVKYFSLSTRALSESKARQLSDLVFKLETLDDLQALFAILRSARIQDDGGIENE